MSKIEINCQNCGTRGYSPLIPEWHRFIAECTCGTKYWVNEVPTRDGSKSYGVVGQVGKHGGAPAK